MPFDPNYPANDAEMRGSELRNQFNALHDEALHLDQTTPQTVTGGTPTFAAGVKIGAMTLAPHPSLPGILNISDNGILLGEVHGPLSEGQPVPPLRLVCDGTEVVKADGVTLAPLKLGEPTQSEHAATRGYVEANTLALDQTMPQAIVNGAPVFSQGLGINSSSAGINWPDTQFAEADAQLAKTHPADPSAHADLFAAVLHHRGGLQSRQPEPLELTPTGNHRRSPRPHRGGCQQQRGKPGLRSSPPTCPPQAEPQRTQRRTTWDLSAAGGLVRLGRRGPPQAGKP